MPSPTDKTWPTSLTSASAPKFWISRFRIAEISAGWIFISVSSHGRTNARELRAQRRIDHARSHFHDEAAEKGGIDLGFEPRIAAELGFQNLFQLRHFRIIERTSTGDGRADFAAQLGDMRVEKMNDVDQGKKAAFAGQCQHEAARQRSGFHAMHYRIKPLCLIFA